MNLLIPLVCLLLNIADNDSNCCNVSAFLIPKNQQIPIYKESNHKEILCYIINDTMTEDYFIATIFRIERNYAYVKGSYVLEEGNDIEGWIEKKYLGTNIISESKVPLYSAPKISSKKIYITNPEWYPIEIIKCYKDWVYIIYEDKNQKRMGWLLLEYQCSNPYTTCN
ncbi:MAG: hypothetical protein LBL74_04570 [Bacteroidales bacterium]|jgi:hypothetical protein|nr:hypothetical protein [Bacteroidales bacterium]